MSAQYTRRGAASVSFDSRERNGTQSCCCASFRSPVGITAVLEKVVEPPVILETQNNIDGPEMSGAVESGGK